MKNWLAIMLCILATHLFGQSAYLSEFNKSQLNTANTADQSNYLTEKEKQVILLINLVRIDPSVFLEKVAEPYIENKYKSSNKYARSLIKDLEKSHRLPPLKPKEDLYKTAQKHALDLGRTGKTGHRSSKGVSFEDRLEHLQQSYYGLAENCQYGFEDPLDIVMSLLIDENVPSLGHRKNILHQDFRYIGVAIEKHKTYRFNCVQDYGGKMIDN